MKTLFLLCFVAICLCSELELPELESKTTELDPFSSIVDCLPLNLKVIPSENETYSITIQAEDSLLSVIAADVEEGALILGLKKGFETKRVIKVTVAMPADALESVYKTSTSVLAIASGMNLKRLNVAASGLAAVRVFDAKVKALDVVAEGSSVIFVQGKIHKADLVVSGTSRVYLYGVNKKVSASTSEIGKTYIKPKNSEVVIDGEVSGLGRTYITDGQCYIRGTFFSAGCLRLAEEFLPKFDAQYSCGLKVNGTISCSAEGEGPVFASAKVDGGSAFSSVSTSSKSGKGGAFASSSASSSVSVSAGTKTGSSASSTGSTFSSSSTGPGGATITSSSFVSSGDHKFDSIVSTSGGEGSVAVAAIEWGSQLLFKILMASYEPSTVPNTAATAHSIPVPFARTVAGYKKSHHRWNSIREKLKWCKYSVVGLLAYNLLQDCCSMITSVQISKPRGLPALAPPGRKTVKAKVRTMAQRTLGSASLVNQNGRTPVFKEREEFPDDEINVATTTTRSSFGEMEQYASVTRSFVLLKPTYQSLMRTVPRKSAGNRPISFAVFAVMSLLYAGMSIRSSISARVKACKSCRGYGIHRCNLCHGHRVIWWEGKYKHVEPCPKCIGLRYFRCSHCGGRFGKTLFAHSKSKRITSEELRRIERDGIGDESWAGNPKFVI